MTSSEFSDSACPRWGFDIDDLRRVEELIKFVRAKSDSEVMAAVLPPGAPRTVRDELVRYCRFVHAAVLVFPQRSASVHEWARAWDLTAGPVLPSTVVRDRLAGRHGLPLSSLEVEIVRLSSSSSPEIEMFMLPAPPGPGSPVNEIARAERADNHETHFAFAVTEPDPVVLRGLRATLTGPGGMTCDGGGFNPAEDVSVFYFRCVGRLASSWPQRVELVACGHQRELLREHALASPDPELAPPLPQSRTALTSDERDRQEMLRLLTGAWTTQAIHAAAQLGLADLIYCGTTSTAGLLAATGASPDELGRLLRYLACIGVLSEESREDYRLTRCGELLRSTTDGSMHDLARLYGGLFYHSFAALGRAVRTGRNAFTEVFGQAPFDYLADHPDDARIFEGAMAAGSYFFRDLPGVIDLSGCRAVVDVGGGDGELLAHLLTTAAHLRGVLFDRPHVLEAARDKLRARDCLERCELVAGDFTREVPGGGDLYLLSRILHDWGDEQCHTILTRCRAAMNDDGTLVLVERVIPDHGAAPLTLGYDLHMMVNNIDGRERDYDEFATLLSRAGFHLYEHRPLSLDMAVLLARPVLGDSRK